MVLAIRDSRLRGTVYLMTHKRWFAGQYHAIPRGLVSGYPARANIGLYCGRDTEGQDLTDRA